MVVVEGKDDGGGIDGGNGGSSIKNDGNGRHYVWMLDGVALIDDGDITSKA